MRFIQTAQVIVVLLFAASTAQAQGLNRQEIRWAYFDKPPLFVTRDDGSVGGICGRIGSLVANGLPEYSHVWQRMPVPRILDDMKNGANVCAVGMIRTPEREAYMSYSLPCRLASPPMLAVRTDDLGRLPVRDGVLSLREVLDSGSVVVGRLSGMSLGRVLDGLLDEYRGVPQLEELYSDHGTVYLFRMLRRGRVDCVPVDMFEASWKGCGFGDDEVTYLRVKENADFETGYVTCPKTPWGRSVIARVNQVLRREVLKPDYFTLFTPYLDSDIQPAARKAFERLVAQPAARMEQP